MAGLSLSQALLVAVTALTAATSLAIAARRPGSTAADAAPLHWSHASFWRERVPIVEASYGGRGAGAGAGLVGGLQASARAAWVDVEAEAKANGAAGAVRAAGSHLAWPAFTYAPRTLVVPVPPGTTPAAAAAAAAYARANATSAGLDDSLYRASAGDAEAEAEVNQLRCFVAMSIWLNGWLLPEAARAYLPHYVAIWLRNLLAGCLLYFGAGGAWCFWIYGMRGDRYFPGMTRPAWEDMRLQIIVSLKAMSIYVLMPTITEWLIEHGYTLCYFAVQDYALAGYGAGSAWVMYGLFTGLYFVFVEWAIYWVHRLLHEVKWGYKHLHAVHHKYNKENTLSPFAGLAFHPIDGCLQAAPYLVGLFLVPVHFYTHLGLLFFTAVWTTNIHDTLNGECEPVMGAAYHTIHHTTYKHNYGQIFLFWDWFYGTLRVPPSNAELIEARRRSPLGQATADADADADADSDGYADGGRGRGKGKGKGKARAKARAKAE